ncbi:ribonuclease P protein subunit [Candidatus Woesearchaeota archaeon]|nr:ribonuclease P protein subunit [Candidatus Woesearchaeota archaeon]
MKAYRMELIGKTVKIEASNNKSLVGLEGTVIDETKHSFVILTSKGKKRVMKKGCTFAFVIDGKTVLIAGDKIDVAPAERIKLK